MTISQELFAQIVRYSKVEEWTVGTIARQLGVHHDTVRRALAQAGLPLCRKRPRPSQIDRYVPFIQDTLTKFPTLTATRLYAMVRQRGYEGGPDHFRHRVGEFRPRPVAEAFLRLRTLPGEQAQVDWGHFGHLQIGRAKRPLMAFVMVLSHCRAVFLRFFLNAQMDSFLRGHVEAFAAFGGCPRVLLYDNLKSAVLERQGDAIRFNPELLRLACHFRFEPRPVAVARGNEKGRVERAIRYVRDNFFAARTFSDLQDLNAQAAAWAQGAACERAWPEDRDLTVGQAFERERTLLMAVPEQGFVLGQRCEVLVRKTPYVRFDLNDYSVPPTLVRRTVSVLADEQCVRIFDGVQEVASHVRCWDRGQQIEITDHVQALVEHKRAARAHRACDALAQAVPASAELLSQAAARGYNLGSITAQLTNLLKRYGSEAMQTAVQQALARGVPHPNAVRLALEQARERSGRPPALALALPEHVAQRDRPVRAHDLGSYDPQETPNE